MRADKLRVWGRAVAEHRKLDALSHLPSAGGVEVMQNIILLSLVLNT